MNPDDTRVPRQNSTFLLIGAALIASGGTWALWPLGPSSVPVPETAPLDLVPLRRSVALDIDAFRTPLFVSPPLPAVVAAIVDEPPPPPPPPTRLQLLAILTDTPSFRAMLYDPDADCILIRSEGDPLGRGTVLRVTRNAMEFGEDNLKRTLTLRELGGAR